MWYNKYVIINLSKVAMPHINNGLDAGLGQCVAQATALAVEIQKYILKHSWSKFSLAIIGNQNTGKHRRALEALSGTRGTSLINYVY
jgi:hypothetical protein